MLFHDTPAMIGDTRHFTHRIQEGTIECGDPDELLSAGWISCRGHVSFYCV